MSITGSGAGYQFGFTPEDAPVIEDFITKESPSDSGVSRTKQMKDYLIKETGLARRRDGYLPQYVRDKDGNITAVRYPNLAEVDYDGPQYLTGTNVSAAINFDGPKFDTKAIRDIAEKMEAQYRAIAAAMSPTPTYTDNRRYTTSGSASPPKKPTKAELLVMLAEIEKTEAKPAMLELDQQRVIDL